MAQAHPPDCLHCTNRKDSEWGSLCQHDLALLNQAKVVNHYRAGQVIFYQGNPPLGIYCIEKGTVVLRKSDVEGRSAIIRVLGKGQTLGYRSFFSQQPYGNSAEAATDCTICWIDKAVVNDIAARNPQVILDFMKHISQDLQDAEENFLRAATLSIRARMAHFLLMLKDKDSDVDDEGRISITLSLSRQDIASMLGTTPETVARTVRGLTDDKVAVFEKRRVLIPDLDRLLDEVECVS
ncbi:MAG: Crp/Fnr family transcriptional regulator [Myxococcota bacterium]